GGPAGTGRHPDLAARPERAAAAGLLDPLAGPGLAGRGPDRLRDQPRPVAPGPGQPDRAPAARVQLHPAGRLGPECEPRAGIYLLTTCATTLRAGGVSPRRKASGAPSGG